MGFQFVFLHFTHFYYWQFAELSTSFYNSATISIVQLITIEMRGLYMGTLGSNQKRCSTAPRRC